MRKLLFILVAIALPMSAMAMPSAFEISYENYAWGYNSRGCLVDFNRYVYKYGYGTSSTGQPIQLIRQLSEQEFEAAQSLISKAAQGSYSESHAAADAGTTHWTARTIWGTSVKLQATGDMEGKNSAPEAQQLVSLMNQWCQGSR